MAEDRVKPHPASYRDPNGRIHVLDGRILRSVTKEGADDFDFVCSTGLYRKLVGEGKLTAMSCVKPDLLGPDREELHALLEHPRLDYITYPYEWCFGALKEAAIFHLELHIEALASGVTLADASAYNVQFSGAQPLFIDHLSFRRYEIGQIWHGHRQFTEQFLTPLLIAAHLGVGFNAWYRGSPEGIPKEDLSALLPLRRKIELNTFKHIVLPTWLQRSARDKSEAELKRFKSVKLPKASHLNILETMRSWITGLKFRKLRPTAWSDYTLTTSYDTLGAGIKRDFVARFAGAVKPNLILDLGCNTGEFSELALTMGATRAIGIDSDQSALNAAFSRAEENGINFFPVHQDLADMSPGQGWRNKERARLEDRLSADALLALAVIHHLAIGRNIPLDQIIDWLIQLAPKGVVEFIPKSDPQVKRMLVLRADVFPNYEIDVFRAQLASRARIIEEASIGENGRVLIWYDSDFEGDTALPPRY